MSFPYGPLVELPSSVVPPECWPEFGLTANPEPICSVEAVGKDPRGVRWSLWPLTFEEYVGDREPSRAASREGVLARNRIMLWKRLSRRDIPAGWHEAKRPWRTDGFFELGSADDYAAKWNHNARRDLKQWEQKFLNTKYVIEDIAFTEFEEAYGKSIVHKKTGNVLLDTLRRRLALPEFGEHAALWGVRNTATGKIIAGTAALFSPTCRASVRECPFTLPEARAAYAATGLMDYWFRAARERGIHTLFSTSFWHPGEPRSWKKFSEFKSHFGFSYVAYPPLLWRFERGQIW